MEFIRRSGDRLYDGDKEFRFISFNIPAAMISRYTDIPVIFPTPPFEQEDLVRSLVSIGGKAGRLYCLPIYGEGVGIHKWNSFVVNAGEYNEDYFLALDMLLEICRKYDFRVILPFVDRYKFIGGIGDYAARRGKKDDPFSDDFYTDRAVISDFKKVIYDVLNRENAYSGIRYKDDPAIMAWETGNELYHDTLYDDWASEIAGYIKSIDRNHLVMDGFYDVRVKAVEDDNFDIVSHHMYPFHAPDFIKEFDKQFKLSEGKKPYVIGEFGFKKLEEIEPFMDHFISGTASGVLAWSLRQRSVYGGILHHRENETYSTYHYPGYDENNGYEERAFVQLMKDKAHQLAGRQIVKKQPLPPFLLPVSDPLDIRFLGSSGADSYIAEVMTDPDQGFTTLQTGITDCAPEGKPYLSDTKTIGIRYYRVRAVASSVVSAPSNIQMYDENGYRRISDDKNK